MASLRAHCGALGYLGEQFGNCSFNTFDQAKEELNVV